MNADVFGHYPRRGDGFGQLFGWTEYSVYPAYGGAARLPWNWRAGAAGVAPKNGISAPEDGILTAKLGLATVESVPEMPKAAAHPGTRGGKLTQAQMEARAQQRSEDDGPDPRGAAGGSGRRLMRWCGGTTSRCCGWRCICSATSRTRRMCTRRPLSRRIATWGTSGSSARFIRGCTGSSRTFALDQLRRRKSRREDPATVLDASGDEMDLMANITDDRAMAKHRDASWIARWMNERIQDALGKLDAARTDGL